MIKTLKTTAKAFIDWIKMTNRMVNDWWFEISIKGHLIVIMTIIFFSVALIFFALATIDSWHTKFIYRNRINATANAVNEIEKKLSNNNTNN